MQGLATDLADCGRAVAVIDPGWIRTDMGGAHAEEDLNQLAQGILNIAEYPIEPASQHHFLYRANLYWPDESAEEAFFERRAARKVSIGHDVWIGHGAIIRPDVTIGNGAVVGAGAVVTPDVAPFTIVVGIPAEKLRRRFSEQVAR